MLVHIILCRCVLLECNLTGDRHCDLDRDCYRDRDRDVTHVQSSIHNDSEALRTRCLQLLWSAPSRSCLRRIYYTNQKPLQCLAAYIHTHIHARIHTCIRRQCHSSYDLSPSTHMHSLRASLTAWGWLTPTEESVQSLSAIESDGSRMAGGIKLAWVWVCWISTYSCTVGFK
jgi:hypothetical protein